MLSQYHYNTAASSVPFCIHLSAPLSTQESLMQIVLLFDSCIELATHNGKHFATGSISVAIIYRWPLNWACKFQWRDINFFRRLLLKLQSLLFPPTATTGIGIYSDLIKILKRSLRMTLTACQPCQEKDAISLSNLLSYGQRLHIRMIKITNPWRFHPLSLYLARLLSFPQRLGWLVAVILPSLLPAVATFRRLYSLHIFCARYKYIIPEMA